MELVIADVFLVLKLGSFSTVFMDSLSYFVGYGREYDDEQEFWNVEIQNSVLNDLEKEGKLCGGSFLYLASGSFERYLRDIEDSGIAFFVLHHILIYFDIYFSAPAPYSCKVRYA